MKEIKLVGLNETIYEHEHKSGLKTYMWVNEKVNSCLMTLSIKYGSIHTEFKVGNKKYQVPNGLAHFLEHVKFNETEDYAAHEYYQKSGGDVNAFTTFDYTSYVVFTTVNLKDNLNHLLDFVYNPFFSKKIVQKEKGIIVEESNMQNDDPYTYSFFRLLKNMLHESKYKELITGETDEVKAITIDDVETVYNSFYHPENSFMCITGNFNPYEMAKIIDENLDNKEFPEYIEPVILNKKEDKTVVKEYEEININVSSSKIRYGIKIPKSKFKDYDEYSLKIILQLILNINFGNTSNLKEELLNKGLITAIGSAVEFVDDYILLIVFAETEYTKEILSRIEDKIANLELDERVINRKKKANIATHILAFDDIESVNSSIQESLVHYNEIITDSKQRLQELNYDMFVDVAEKITGEPVSILIVNPNKSE